MNLKITIILLLSSVSLTSCCTHCLGGNVYTLTPRTSIYDTSTYTSRTKINTCGVCNGTGLHPIFNTSQQAPEPTYTYIPYVEQQ